MRAHISRRNVLKIAGTAAGTAAVGTALPTTPASAADRAFAHPRLLHTRADLDRT
ncbi:twin-arginine translocation signal domain-containing protein [Streptomyces sp. TRM64462]|uniref:twin-arginine translocation signal domain-containing protein n=1 Tax=Streptomyces sp. TRM64462 TaxID=2741726 RepID=UPI0028166DF7|nr:twin-arginine translocation signal domain-containing protein [Streptomyces sp. TRM64462]